MTAGKIGLIPRSRATMHGWIATAMICLGLGFTPAKAQGLTAEGRALIAAGMSGDQFYDAMSRFRGSAAQEEGETMLRLARLGHPVAIQVIASECLSLKRCITTPDEAHAMLAESAKTDATSATDLGVTYKWGWYGDADALRSAQWLKFAHSLGSDRALIFLRDLPREAVVQAGAQSLLEEKPTPITEQLAGAALLLNPNAFAESIAGGDAGPTILPYAGKGGFPVFADTAASNVGDAALSCTLVLQAESKRLYAQVKREAAAGTATKVDVYFAQSASDKATKAIETMRNPELNGGLEGMALNVALQAHQLNYKKTPSRGPSLDFCNTEFVLYILSNPADR